MALASASSDFGIAEALVILGTVALAIYAFWKFDQAMKKLRNDVDELFSSKEFAALAGLVIGGILVAKVIKAGFAFLKDVNWERVGDNLSRAMESAYAEIERQPSGLARLQRAQELLEKGDEIERDQSAMLASATLELGLRSLARRRRLSVAEDEGLAGLAIRLGSDGHITRTEQEMIKRYASRVRNRVMHGDLGSIDHQDVAGLIASSQRFFNDHRLS